MKKCWTTPFPHCFMGASFPVLRVLLCWEDKKHAWLSGSYALSESFTKKTSCHFQHSTQISGIKSKTIKHQAQWNTLTQLTTAIAHVLSLCQLALPHWPQQCHLGVLLLSGRKEGLLWREISGISERVDLGWHCLHCTPWSIACHEQQRSMREVLAVGDTSGSHGAAASSPEPTPHSASDHFHTHRSMKEGQWQTGNFARNTAEELLSSIHRKLTPYWLMCHSNKAKK